MPHDKIVEEILQKFKEYHISFYSPYPNQDDKTIVQNILTTTAQRVREETIRQYSPYIEHRIECIKQFEEDAECDCGLSTLNK